MIFDRKVVALVPMKDHSERVPGKNMRSFAGKPLFHHIVSTLVETFVVDTVVIDTDSATVAAAAPQWAKVQVIDRPEELCGDMVSMNKVIAYDIEQVPADIYIQTHATNPLLRSETITHALQAFAKSQTHDSLFSANRLQTRLYTADAKPINHDPEDLIRTQDLPPIYEENSCIYVFTAQSFAQSNRRIGHRPLIFETDRVESIDIDDEYTFRLAEMLASYAKGIHGGGV